MRKAILALLMILLCAGQAWGQMLHAVLYTGEKTPPSPPSNFILRLWAKLLAWLHTVRF